MEVLSIIKKEYRFLNGDSKFAQLLFKNMKNEECNKNLKDEGVFLTSTGIIIMLNKPKSIDDISDLETIKLDVHFSKVNGNGDEWVHFPMTNTELTRFLGKYHGVDHYIIEETSSNCGLTLYTYLPILRIEEYVISIQTDMIVLNELSTVEEVSEYSKLIINALPAKIVEICRFGL